MRNSKKNNLESSNGITLIALVLTIVVMLILLGVTISMITGDNNLLQKSKDAKKESVISEEKERIQTEVFGSYESDGELLVGTVNNNIKTHIDGVTTDDATEFPLTVTYTETGHTYKVSSDGTLVEIRNYSDTIKSSLTEGTYVQYNSKPYRVLYDINSGYGWIEIVSVNPLKKVKLGYDDPNVEASDFIYTGTATIDDNWLKAAASYNRAITTLHEAAQDILVEDLADRARCVGSDPINPTQEATAWLDGGAFSRFIYYGLNEKFKALDANYSKGSDTTALNKDYDQLSSIGALKYSTTSISQYYYFASRSYNSGTDKLMIGLRGFKYNGTYSTTNLLQINYDGTTSSYHPNYGIRPVIRLKENIKIISGSGSEDSPYVLGAQ